MSDVGSYTGMDQPELPGIEAAPADTPIDRLRPESDLHKAVLQKLLDRIQMSERKMSPFYARWRYSEKKMQAHVDLPEYEQLLKQLAARNAQPEPIVTITVPYTFATVWTIVTYLIQAFAGRKPLFQIGSNKAEQVEAAEKMETVIQYNADHMRLARALFQWFLDGEMYGVGVIRTRWEIEQKYRTTVSKQPVGGQLAPDTPMANVKNRELRTVYEGNYCASVDPFMFFPDPRVPMSEVNRRGEFVFWRTYEGTHTLMSAQAKGELKWVDYVKNSALPTNITDFNQSSRNLQSNGDAHAGNRTEQEKGGLPFFQVDQGTVEIIPSDWGLGDSTVSEKWIFTILNKKQIVQAEPLELDHDMHPVAIIEPYSFGYGFGQIGLTDMTNPLQDTISWFINSHIHNVRSTLNNSFIVNPSAVEMQDLKNPKPGKIIRLKPSAYGVDVRTIIQQLQVTDVTRSHVADMQEFIRMGDTISAVNDNLRGIQSQGGRKTATEVRTSSESGASRLSSHARLISAQGVIDLTEQMSLNLQQNLSQEMYLKIVGQDGQIKPSIIRPEDLVGDFYYPIHDGTLPIDRVAMLDVWKEILMGVMQDPQLRMSYDVGKIFEFVAELGGAKNITSFKIMQPEQMAQAAQAGNAMPVPTGGGGAMPPQLQQLMAALGGQQ